MKKIKLFDPVVGKEEEKVIIKTLKSRFWASGSGVGNVGKFEDKFNQYIGSKHCVAVNNGTSALHLALSLTDIRKKEVLLPSMSFVSTAHAVIYNGGIPVFVDVDPNTLCMDPSAIQKSITKKTKLILPVHFGGMSCAMDEITDLCKKHDLFLIDDAAHAAGTNYKGKKIGMYGLATCFSFHPVKNLAMPTGGAITLNGKNSDKLRNILYSRRWCGISDRVGSTYDVKQLGWNYYMNEFSAAIGLEQLKKLDRMNGKRKKIAKRYVEEINLNKKMPYDNGCSYHFFWVRVNNRSNFMKKMIQNGIETGIHYKPIHKMTYYLSSHHLPVTDNISEQIVSLPIHPNLSEVEISHIIKSVNKFAN